MNDGRDCSENRVNIHPMCQDNQKMIVIQSSVKYAGDKARNAILYSGTRVMPSENQLDVTNRSSPFRGFPKVIRRMLSYGSRIVYCDAVVMLTSRTSPTLLVSFLACIPLI